MPEPVFGVVLLNWNGFADTAESLDSLRSAQPRPAHVVVVDNGSHDDSLARLDQWAKQAEVPYHRCAPQEVSTIASTPWLLVIAVDRNIGFACGNNLGLEYLAHQTNATHFLLLNNDAMVAPDYFAQLANALQTVPNAGLMGSAIYYAHDHTKVWYAGGREIPGRALVLHEDHVPNESAPQPTPFVTGCAMLIARPLYDRLGGLAACYTPIYWEDTDYSFQAVQSGLPVMWAPAAKVYHKVGASVGGERITPQVAFWQNRHRGYYVRRNYRGVNRLLALGYLMATKPARSLVEVLRGRFAMGSAIWRGFVAGVFGAIPT